MADINGTFADFSDDEDTQDINLDDLDDLPDKDPIVKNLNSEFTVEPTPSKILTRQSISHNREHMKVYLRIRPFTGNEVDKGESQDTMKVESPSCLIMQAPKDSFTFKSSQRGFGEMTHKFTFTRIFDEETNQKSLFDDTMLGTVKDFVDGQNCLVFTYGVTNAGKTHTIQGTPQDGGILPRALDVVFNSIEGRQFSSLRLKPRLFCDVVRLSDKQILKEVENKKKVLALAECEPPKHIDKSQIDKSTQDMEQDSLAESDTSRASHYSTATEESVLSESGQDVSKLMEGIPNVWEDIRSRIPDDTSIDVEAQGPIKFSVWVSFAEIYNEYIYDLLEEIPKGKKARRQPLKLASDKHGSIYIKGLKEIQVENADEAYRVLKIGQNNRSIASTKLNQCSSRSHCIFSMKIMRVVDVDEPHVARVSKLSFCDLAGSERYTKTQNTGERLKEAGNINTSLLTLGKCIHTLRYNQNHPKVNPKIIPFRESKLTRLFQSFFLGKGKAHMIVNVNQCASGFDETMHVLKFSAIAKQVTTVTSKLDNKWKEPPRKLASARHVSLVINQSLGNKKREVRPSIAWATPGTAKEVAEELSDLDEIEESVLETEEEEGGDLDVTPVGETTFEDDQNVTQFKKVIEVLKSKLIEEKQKSLDLEMNLREEICQEMAQQIVQIEEDYNERLREEQEVAEEKFERKLELYTKSVKKANKRRRKDDDADEDEYVSSGLLAAEQVKVQQRDAKIEELETIVEKLKSESAKDEEEMSAQNQTIMELQSLVESTKVALEEANERLCTKESQLEQVQSDLQTYRDTSSMQASQMTELKEKAETVMKDQQNICEALKHEIAKNEQEAKQALAESRAQLKKKDDEIANLKNAKVEASEADEEIKMLNNELSEKVKDAEQALAQHVGFLEDREIQIAELKREVESAAKQERELTKVKNELEMKLAEAEKAQTATDSLIEEKEAEIKKLSCNLTFVQQSLKEAQEQQHVGDETAIFEVEEQRVKMENLEECSRQAEKATANLQSKLEAVQQEHCSERTELQSQLANTQEQLKSRAEEIERLEKEVKSIQEEGESRIQNLMSQLDSANRANSEVISSKDNEHEAFERLQQEAEQLREQTGSLQEKLEINLQESTQQVDSLTKELQKARVDLESMKQVSQATVKDLTERLQNTKVELEESHEVISSNSSEISDLQGQMESLKQKLESSTEVSTKVKKELEKLQFKVQESEEAVKDGESVSQLLKNQVKTVEADLEKEKQTTEELTAKVKELEDTLADLQERFDEANETGREASGRIRNLEESLGKAKHDLSEERAAHKDSKEASSSYEARISEMRISLEMSERTAASMAKQIKRTKDLEGELETTKKALAEKTEQADKLSSVSGDADQMKSKVQNLEEKLRTAEQQLEVTKHSLQDTLSKCSSLEQSLESKKDCVRDQQSKMERLQEDLEAKRSEVAKLQENQTHQSGDVKDMEENCQRLEQELTNKTGTINMLMKKMERKCQEVKTAQQKVKSTEEAYNTLKSALQEQEELMTQQDKLLNIKEDDYKATLEDLETLKEKYDALVKSSSDDHTSLRQAQRDLVKSNNEKSAQEQHKGAKEAELESAKKKEEDLIKEVKTLKETLEETNTEVKDLEKELGMARTNLSSKEEEMAKMQENYERTQLELEKMQEQCERNQKELKERRKEVTELREKVESNDMEDMQKQQDVKDKMIAKLEKQLEEQEKMKEAQLESWRKEKDSLLSALEGELKRLREKAQKAMEALADKENYIDQLKKEMLEKMSLSAAFTDDDGSEEDNRRATRKSMRSSRNSRNSRSKGETKSDSSDGAIEDSDHVEPVRKRTRGSRRTLQAVKEEPIVIEDSPVVKKEADVIKEEAPVVKEEPPTPNMKQEEIEEPIYEEPPSEFYTSSSSDSGRQASMVILEPDETDSSRVEMDVTPLQKNTRKTRNARRGKKRKSTEMLEEEIEAATGSRKKGAARNTRGRRRTRAACREESEQETENQPSGYTADGPLPPPGRNSRKALSKIGDMFQNSPFGKSAKKLVDNMQSPKQSPPRTVEVSMHGKEIKKRRKLYKTEISSPYDCSPYETLSQQMEGTKVDEPPRPVEQPTKSEGIVTRKLRSRRKKNKADY